MLGVGRQTAVFAAAAAAMLIVELLAAPGAAGQAMILAPAVAILGLPHGALDLAVAQRLWPLHGARDHAVFFAVYIAIALAVLAIWLLTPGPALAVFLGYSALHFSGDWRGWGWLWRLAGGLATVGAPALFHAQQVQRIFAVLAPERAAGVVADGLVAVGVIAAVLALLAAARDPAPRRLGEHATLWPRLPCCRRSCIS